MSPGSVWTVGLWAFFVSLVFCVDVSQWKMHTVTCENSEPSSDSPCVLRDLQRLCRSARLPLRGRGHLWALLTSQGPMASAARTLFPSRPREEPVFHQTDIQRCRYRCSQSRAAVARGPGFRGLCPVREVTTSSASPTLLAERSINPRGRGLAACFFLERE